MRASITSQLEHLNHLRGIVETQIPETASTSNIWGFLGWDEAASEAYGEARAYGIDLRPLLAPDFSDIVSIVVDGAYGFPYAGKTFNWTGILNGDVAKFAGRNPKERLLSVIKAAIEVWLDG